MTQVGGPVLPAIAIVCGQGSFPVRVARCAQAAGRAVFLVGIRGVAGPEIAEFPHIWLGLGEIGSFLGALRQRSITQLAIVGGMTRPALSDMRIDVGGLRKMPELARLFLGGDNHLLSGVLRILEAEGLTIVGAQEIAPDLLAPLGIWSAARPDPQALADIALAQNYFANASQFDVGQGLIVQGGRILAVEAAEGTDAMIARVGQLRHNGRLRLQGRAGLLVKAPKRGQDLRIDLPAVGPRTLELVVDAQLAGLALASGQVLVLDRAAFVAQANTASLFLYGFAAAAGA